MPYRISDCVRNRMYVGVRQTNERRHSTERALASECGRLAAHGRTCARSGLQAAPVVGTPTPTTQLALLSFKPESVSVSLAEQSVLDADTMRVGMFETITCPDP